MPAQVPHSPPTGSSSTPRPPPSPRYGVALYGLLVPINPSLAAAWKRNLLRIERLVLIGGPDDGVITPWQSR